MASDGVVEYLFHDLIPGMSPVEIVAQNFEQVQYSQTFNSAIVAVDGNAVVGMTLSYPSSFHEITDEMRKNDESISFSRFAGVRNWSILYGIRRDTVVRRRCR